MKAIERFLQEAKIITPIAPDTGIEIRFVLDNKNISHLNIDPSKAIDFTDYYLNGGKRYRKIEKSPHHRTFDQGRVYEIEGCGKVNKKITEIDEETLKDALKNENVLFYIIKRGIGHFSCNNIVEGYCEKVIAKTTKIVIFDETQCEFEGIKNKKQFDQCLKFVNPIKVFQASLYEYTLNTARRKGLISSGGITTVGNTDRPAFHRSK